MKRFELVFGAAAMWVGAEIGGAIGFIGAVVAYVVLAELAQFGFRKIMKKLKYVRKAG